MDGAPAMAALLDCDLSLDGRDFPFCLLQTWTDPAEGQAVLVTQAQLAIQHRHSALIALSALYPSQVWASLFRPCSAYLRRAMASGIARLWS